MSKIVKEKKLTYSEWWESPIETINGYKTEEGKYITHGMYVKYFYKMIQRIVFSKGYEFDDEKQLKREIATLIYNLSEETK